MPGSVNSPSLMERVRVELPELEPPEPPEPEPPLLEQEPPELELLAPNQE